MTTRIYKVDVQHGQGEVKTYLVDANSPHQARQHVAKKFMASAIAKPREIVDLMQAGAKVEEVSADE